MPIHLASPFSPDGLSAYLDDQLAGLSRWTNSGGTWTQAYNFPAVSTELAGLVVDWSKANPVMYATTTNTSGKSILVSLVDTGGASAFTTLATGPANTEWRGVTFAPQPLLNQFLAASDFGPGFVGGENLGFTNVSGGDYYVWASSDRSVSVTNWTLAGQTTEEVLGASGNSRYVFNVAPATSPTYYIFAQTNFGPFAATEPLSWVTTSEYLMYDVTNATLPITAGGVFVFPTLPVITQQPVSQAVLTGQNASFSVSATGSGLNYQWLFNTAGIAGATAPLLGLTNVSPANAGPYAVVVTNSFGSATSSIVHLMVASPPALSLASASPGTIHLNASSVSNLTYVVQTTTNLAHPVWANILTNNTGLSGVLSFQTNTSRGQSQFYRLAFP